MTQAKPEEPPSPCIGICRLDAATQTCIGCYRTIDEISAWPRYTAEEKHAVLERLLARRAAAGAVKRCPRCGGEFVCAAPTGKRCWCDDVPPVMPRPDAAAECLCPACLNDAVAQALERRPRGG